MRKILSLVLVLSLVLGSMSMAFAASDLTADIENEAVKEAVQRLAAFGIVNGMDDGKYHPEKKVTREQFAKLVVEALGLGTAAEAAKGSTQFADVEADRWSSGYVNTAIGQGVLKGYPDGTFKPTKEVSYGEAITMLVRALGYKDEFLPGSWPGNYVAKAAELDITDDVNFAPSGTADRGSVAVMVNNTLDADVIKVDTYDGDSIKYEESNISLLEDKLDIDKVEDIRVIATKRLDDKLEADELRLLALEDKVGIDGVNYDEKDEIEVEFTGSVNAEALIGLEITGYFDGDELMFTEVETPESSYYRGIAYEDGYEGDATSDQGKDDDGKILLRGEGKYYKFDENVQLYINNEDRTDDIEFDKDEELMFNLTELLQEYDPQNGDESYAFGNVVLEKGKVTFVDVAVFETQNGIVEEVNEDDKMIEYVDTYTTDVNTGEELDLDDYDEFHVYTTDGASIELADIEKDDVIYFYEDGEDDDKAYVMVKRAATVAGELTKVKRGESGKGQSRGKVYLGEDSYYLASRFAYSLDEMDSLKGIGKAEDLDDIFEDVYNEDVKLVLDTKGRVALFSTDVDATTGNYAVVIKTDQGLDDELKLWTETGDTIVYDVDDYEDGIEFEDLAKGDIIEYDLEDDGTVDVIAKVYDASSEEAEGDNAQIVTLDEINKDNVEDEDSDNYFDQADSLYIDYSEYKDNGDNDDDDLDVLKWDDFKDLDIPSADSNNAVKALIVTDEDEDDEIELLAFVDNYDEVADDDSYVGYLVSYETDDDAYTVTVDVFGEGEQEYKVTDDDDQDAIKDAGHESLIVFVLRGGELKLKEIDEDYDDNEHYGSLDEGEVNIWFKDKDGDDIELYVGSESNVEEYKVDDDAVIYYDDESKNLNKLEEGDALEFIMKDGEILVIKYVEEADLEDEDKYDADKEDMDLEVEDEDVTLKVGDTADIEVTVDPSSADVTFESDDEDVATVDEDGEITAVAEGTATITVTAKKTGYETETVEVEVTVTEEAVATADVTVETLPFGTSTVFNVTLNSVDGLDDAAQFTVGAEDAEKVDIGDVDSASVVGDSVTMYVFDADGDLLATADIADGDTEVDLTLE
ncbi:S-layer homology domain-containing protein [Wukongibacter baidiensis]|uniref:S-layer homology domain-containing protein n=1 Tax=Wukongibacter baidiensis TaxID=1723361 RepID=UPI003D7FD61D